MRVRPNKRQHNEICAYFLRSIISRYLLPSFVIFVPVFLIWFVVVQQATDAHGVFSTTLITYLVLAIIQTSVAAASIIYTLQTCAIGFNQIVSQTYITVSMRCISKRKGFCGYYCTLADGISYRVYGKREFDRIKENMECELIVIANNYGAKIWEFVIVPRKK